MSKSRSRFNEQKDISYFNRISSKKIKGKMSRIYLLHFSCSKLNPDWKNQMSKPNCRVHLICFKYKMM